MNILQRIKIWTFNHKKTTSAIVVATALIGYSISTMAGSANADSRYVLATATKGTIVSSVSGSGQVSASNEVTLSTKASGELTTLNVKAGQVVKAGAVIARVDARDAAYDLESEQLTYNKLVTVDPNALDDAKNAVVEAEDGKDETYMNARAALIAQSSVMATTLDDIGDLFNGYLSTGKQGLSKTARASIDKAEAGYYAADDLMADFVKKYKTISTQTDEATIETTLADAQQTAMSISEGAKYAQDAVVQLRNQEDNTSTDADSAYTTINTLANTSNASVTSLASAKTSIANSKRTIVDAQNDLKDLEDGPDTLDLRSAQLALRQKQEALADYSVTAPFDGVIASVAVQKGDTVNSGTEVATLITKQKIAEITLNEVDVAKIAVDQKATVTFDAIDDLTITGTVAEVDLIGTVSQGVVSYNVKIGFDTDDDRIKPGMTANASIITDTRVDVLIVPISAVKTQGDTSYVEVLKNTETATNDAQGVISATPPTKLTVTTGLANDDSIEILSGLNEGDQYVSRTIKTLATTAKTTTTPTSILGGTTTRTTGTAGFSGGGFQAR